MSALKRMHRPSSDERQAALDNALDDLAHVFGDPETAWHVGPQFSCAEADTIASVLVASRHDDAAVVWLQAHAARDTTDARHGGGGFDAKRYLSGRYGPT